MICIMGSALKACDWTQQDDITGEQDSVVTPRTRAVQAVLKGPNPELALRSLFIINDAQAAVIQAVAEGRDFTQEMDQLRQVAEAQNQLRPSRDEL